MVRKFFQEKMVKPVVVPIQEREQVTSTVELHGEIQMRRVLKNSKLQLDQVDFQEPHLEGIVQLGEPRTGCPGHDVPFLAIKGRNILPNFLHHLQCIHLQIFRSGYKSTDRDEFRKKYLSSAPLSCQLDISKITPANYSDHLFKGLFGLC